MSDVYKYSCCCSSLPAKKGPGSPGLVSMSECGAFLVFVVFEGNGIGELGGELDHHVPPRRVREDLPEEVAHQKPEAGGGNEPFCAVGEFLDVNGELMHEGFIAREGLGVFAVGGFELAGENVGADHGHGGAEA